MDQEEIKVLRETLGLSQQELGVKLGLVAITVSRWERGISQPRREALRGLEQLRRDASKPAREGALVKKVMNGDQGLPPGQRPRALALGGCSQEADLNDPAVGMKDKHSCQLKVGCWERGHLGRSLRAGRSRSHGFKLTRMVASSPHPVYVRPGIKWQTETKR